MRGGKGANEEKRREEERQGGCGEGGAEREGWCSRDGNGEDSLRILKYP